MIRKREIIILPSELHASRLAHCGGQMPIFSQWHLHAGQSYWTHAPVPWTPHPRTHKAPWRWHLSEVLGYLSSTVKSSDLGRQYGRVPECFCRWYLGHMSASALTGCAAPSLGSDLSCFKMNRRKCGALLAPEFVEQDLALLYKLGQLPATYQPEDQFGQLLFRLSFLRSNVLPSSQLPL